MHRHSLVLLHLLAAAVPLSAQPGKGPARSGWLTDFSAAKAEAKRTGKPIFVVFRCEPCGETGQFDDEVRRLAPEIAPAASQFVRLRLTRITGVDLRLFDFDCDVTWFAFFLNADEHVYGRYGGRDAAAAQSRISLKGLRFALEQALEAHKAPPQPEARADKPLRAEDLAANRRVKGNCIHCHNINEFRRADMVKEGTWRRDLVWAYPLPENIGLTLDVDRGSKVASVRADSPAAKAGIKTGDILKTLNRAPVASFADAAFGLNRAPNSGTIPVKWQRDGQEQSADIIVAEGWRKTNLSWRPSLFDLLPRLEFSGDELKPEEKKTLGFPEKRFAFRQDKFVHSTLKAIGLQKDDVLVGIDGAKIDGTFEAFMAYVRSNFINGDMATLNLLRAGQPFDLKVTFK